MKLKSDNERGTALIAALLLVALMATVSVKLVDVARFSVFRTGHIDTRSESYWQALGARAFVEGVISRGVEGSVMRADLPWLNEPQVFLTDDGLVSGVITDANNCLNVNALVGTRRDETEDGNVSGVERVRERYDLLMDRISAPTGQSRNLKAQIIDWIDADTRPEPGGAEDAAYQRFETPYRTGNQPMAEREELLALQDMTPDFYAFVEPWLCALPTSEQPPLNVNTLTLEQAPLLAAAFSQRLDVSDAEGVLFRRPPQGYDTLEDFFADPSIEVLELDELDRAAVTLRSRWFSTVISVRNQETRFTISQIVELNEAGLTVRHQQRFGAL